MVTPTYPSFERQKGPGRPPNAWIIYRKTKLATLPPVPPGQPRRAQAEVSKIISKMWREEPDAVKAEFERRAETEKAIHLKTYPDYKFNPESKADKEKRKAAKAAQRELERANSKRGRAHAAPYIVPVVTAPSSVHVTGAAYDSASFYGNAGPSPALSGASSPTSSKSAPQPLPPADQRSQLFLPHFSAHSSHSAEPYQNQQNSQVRPSSAPDMYVTSMPPLLTRHPDIAHSPLPDPGQYQPQNQPQPQQQENYSADLTSWIHIPSNDGQVTLQRVTAEEYASYQTMGWNGEQNTDLQHATAFATGDPSIFSLEGFDFNNFLHGSSGEIEVSMGTQEMPFSYNLQSAPYAQLANLFGTYDYTGLSGASSSQDNSGTGASRNLSPVQVAAPPSFFSSNTPETPVSHASSSPTVPQQNGMSPITPQSFFNSGVEDSPSSSGVSSFGFPQQQQVHSSYGSDAFQQYFDFDAHSSLSPLDTNTTPPRPAPPSQSQTMMTHNSHRTSPPQHTSYAPPSAAAYTGSRRVAASWNPPRSGPDSPIEHSPTGAWPSYPVTARS